MDDYKIKYGVKYATIAAYVMWFACLSAIIIMHFTKEGSVSTENKTRYAMDFLFYSTLVFVGIFAAYKHSFKLLILLAVLTLLRLINQSIWLDIFRSHKDWFWDVTCAEVVALALCVVFTTAFAFIVKRSN